MTQHTPVPDPYMAPNEKYGRLRIKYYALQRSIRQKVGRGILGGAAAGAIITALLMQDCNGKKDHTSNNNDAEVTDAGVYNTSTDDASIAYDAGKTGTSRSDADVSYDAGVSDAGRNDAGLAKCADIAGCYDQKYVDDLITKQDTCTDNLEVCNQNLEVSNGNLEACLRDKVELSKRPKICVPTNYGPRTEFKIEQKCPYIRRGE